MKMLRFIPGLSVVFAILSLGVVSCALDSSEDKDDPVTQSSSVEGGTTLKLQGTIEDSYDPMTQSVSEYSHTTGTEYRLVDERDRSFVLAEDTGDDAQLDITYGTPPEDDLYATSEIGATLTFSDTTVKLLQAVLITDANTSDGIVLGDVEASPLEYYTYMYSSGAVDISGDVTQGIATISYDEVSLSAGWNILHVENPMDGSVTLSNDSVVDSAWFMIDAP